MSEAFWELDLSQFHPYPSYKENSPLEERLLEIADVFERQYRGFYPERKPLLLCPLNECEIRKFVSTTLRPTLLPYKELYFWEGCASFTADSLSLELLDDSTSLPKYLFSPTFMLQCHKATSFDFSTLLCSLLLGAGYNAYCVSGYADKEMCLLGQTLQECPLMVTKREEFEVKELSLRSLSLHETQRLQRQHRPSDPLLVHCWVLVLSEGRSRKVAENFFIDPLTGIRYSTTHKHFVGIESVWNQYNYWVNVQQDICKEVSFNLEDLDVWQPLLYSSDSQKLTENAPRLAEKHRLEKEEEDERRRLAEEAAEKLRQEEAERLRLEAVEAERLRRREEEGWDTDDEEAERVRLEEEEAERLRLEEEEAERLRLEADEKSKMEPVVEEEKQEQEEGDPTNLTQDTESQESQQSPGEELDGPETPQEDMEPDEYEADGINVEDRAKTYFLKDFLMPPSWVNKIVVSSQDLETRYPDGRKVTHYRKAKLERFAPYLLSNGLVTRLTTYKDLLYTQPIAAREWFQHRHDHLLEKEIELGRPDRNMTVERFSPGRSFCLKFHRYTPLSKNVARELEFYAHVRSDGLIRRVQLPWETTEVYQNRKDFLYYRYIVPGLGTGPIEKVIDRFHRDRSKPASEDVAERVFLLTDERVEVTYHLEEERITPKTRYFIKSPRTETWPAGTPSDSCQTSIDLIKEEEKVLREVKDSELELKTILSSRQQEDDGVELQCSIFNERIRKRIAEKEQKKIAEKEKKIAEKEKKIAEKEKKIAEKEKKIAEKAKKIAEKEKKCQAVQENMKPLAAEDCHKQLVEEDHFYDADILTRKEENVESMAAECHEQRGEVAHLDNAGTLIQKEENEESEMVDVGHEQLDEEAHPSGPDALTQEEHNMESMAADMCQEQEQSPSGDPEIRIQENVAYLETPYSSEDEYQEQKERGEGQEQGERQEQEESLEQERGESQEQEERQQEQERGVSQEQERDPIIE